MTETGTKLSISFISQSNPDMKARKDTSHGNVRRNKGSSQIKRIGWTWDIVAQVVAILW